jgi:hypothetical protein
VILPTLLVVAPLGTRERGRNERSAVNFTLPSRQETKSLDISVGIPGAIIVATSSLQRDITYFIPSSTLMIFSPVENITGRERNDHALVGSFVKR